ncbi:hypothetical protein CDAR_412501 [Caerostris darwini]|uniref:Uncharacterized protein n=1 Tax=Caerostris darwini TaxID=1538125 RepID=A0AAV4QNW3_9ARAC|nr:hypothetical protein CDAR_412501 [Caerostris darwini]
MQFGIIKYLLINTLPFIASRLRHYAKRGRIGLSLLYGRIFQSNSGTESWGLFGLTLITGWFGPSYINAVLVEGSNAKLRVSPFAAKFPSTDNSQGISLQSLRSQVAQIPHTEGLVK